MESPRLANRAAAAQGQKHFMFLFYFFIFFIRFLKSLSDQNLFNKAKQIMTKKNSTFILEKKTLFPVFSSCLPVVQSSAPRLALDKRTGEA